MQMITRFAPSPTGPLHLGHAYSAIIAHDLARAAGGDFLLRIEDIDPQRAKPVWEAQIYDDLHWLGLTWDGPVMRQSDRRAAYDAALDQLWDMGLLYPCRCTRRDIELALGAPQEGGWHYGPDGAIYPGTCRDTHRAGPRPKDQHLRLDIARAFAKLGRDISFTEVGPLKPGLHSLSPSQAIRTIGDIVLVRRDFGTSYHLSVVIDDAAQKVTHAVRGVDLFDATAIHALLQNLLNLPQPSYYHHDLIRDANGKRLAKRDDARAISTYRHEGVSPATIRQMIGLGR